MHPTHSRFAASLALAFLAAAVPRLSADQPGIHTNRPSPRVLPLPKGDDVFHFVVFGDRTGGPAEGIKVLAQAVADTNLLDPDLVMTVGDLVNGYNQTAAWMEQMREFRATMDGLNMPWFPVAGNHDIFWRRDRDAPEAKPAAEHEEHYRTHFGPLWYWFEHKRVGFLVLFTDEGHPDGRARDFNDPEQQRISPAQMEWLAGALAEMKDLEHVFVFLHHPFWIERYPGSNWDSVHALLAKNGNVRAVLAGHIHRMTYSGLRDGIDYYSLATTGGSLPREMEGEIYFGFLHHFNVVTVRKEGYKMASLPVGGVFDPKAFDPLREKDGDLIRYLHHVAASPPIPLTLDGSAGEFYRVAVENPSSLPLEVTVEGKGEAGWMVIPDHRHDGVAPGARLELEFACVRRAAPLAGFRPPEFAMTFDVLTPGGRIAMPARTLPAKLSLRKPAAGWPPAEKAGQFAFDGRSACLRVEPEPLRVPEGPFTVEAWVKPAGRGDGAVVSNRRANAGFGLEIAGAPAFIVRAGGEWRSANAAEKLAADAWTHLAGVHDGESVSLFVNGVRVANVPAGGAPEHGASPLYIGAMPSGGWVLYDYSRPAEFWRGRIDAVRVSAGARYARDFQPDVHLPADAATVFQLASDQRFGPFAPADGSSGLHALILGDVEVVHEER